MKRTVNIAPKDRIFWVICEPEENGAYFPYLTCAGYTRFHAWEAFYDWTYSHVKPGEREKEMEKDPILEFKRRCQKGGYIAVKMRGVLSK